MLNYIMNSAVDTASPEFFEKMSNTVIGRAGSFLAQRFSDGNTDALFWVVAASSVLVCLLAPYFLGSINFGIIVSKLLHGEDIREYGSGNAGMTNMLRTYGKRDAVITLAGDAVKAVVAVILGKIIFGITGGYIAGFACIVGHAFPCYYRFKGGKGVVVTAATVAVIDWRMFLILLAVFVLMVAISRFISLGSVTCMLVFPLLVQAMNKGLSINLFLSIAIAALVVYLHRSNIVRIYHGKESKLSFTKTDKHKKDGSDQPPSSSDAE